jgi:hypothetical protein
VVVTFFHHNLDHCNDCNAFETDFSLPFRIHTFLIMSKLWKIALVLTITLFLLEITTRFVYEKPWVHGYSFNEFTGVSLTPNTNGWWTREGKGFVEINSRGMRDNREYEHFSKDNIYRIAVVGDSYVEALQVNVNETFWRLMEVRLNSQCNSLKYKEFEVLPFGVSGHGPAQYMLNIKHKVSKLNPDLVLVVFTPGNDFRNSVESLENDPVRPYLVENSESKKLYSWDFSFREEAFKLSALSKVLQTTDHSRFLSLIQEIILRIRTVIQSSPRLTEMNENNGSKVNDLGDNYIYLPYDELPKEWKKSRRVVEQIVSSMAKLDKSNHPIIGVIGTSGVQIHPSINVRDKFTKILGVSNLEEPSNYFTRVLQDSGMKSIDLLPQLSKASAEDKIGLHGEAPNWGGHWNLKGHSEVAEILSKEVCHSINSFD